MTTWVLPIRNRYSASCFVSLAVAATETTRVHLGPSVTHPLTRHPAVTASAIASLQELSDGRAFLGIGTGDSAVLNLGLRPARMRALREYVDAVRTFLNGGTAEYLGREAHVRWSQSPVPIMMSARRPAHAADGGCNRPTG